MIVAEFEYLLHVLGLTLNTRHQKHFARRKLHSLYNVFCAFICSIVMFEFNIANFYYMVVGNLNSYCKISFFFFIITKIELRYRRVIEIS